MDYLNSAFEIIKKINSIGYEAYIVGGAVRDYLLGIKLNDIDLTTNMPLSLVKELFSCEDTGIDYMGITIKINEFSYEITEFRRDCSYLDNRHPVVMRAESFYEDSFRRDFTINALAMDANRNIIDYHNGKKDLQLKLIRAIGNPDTRFNEDSLRILRALYYASKLDFTIEEDTLNSIIRNKHLLANLSDTRIFYYIKKLTYVSGNKGLEYIKKYDLFSSILEYKDWLLVIDKNILECDLCLAFYIKYKRYPSVASAIDKKRSKVLEELLDNNLNNYIIFKYYNEINDYFSILKYYGYDIISLGKIRDNLCLKCSSDLAISTKEITDDYEGKEKGLILRKVYEAILNGEIDNSKEAIMTYLRSSK